MKNLIVVEGPNKESVKELGKLILEILKSGQEQETICSALQVLSNGVTNRTTIRDCTFTQYPKEV